MSMSSQNGSPSGGTRGNVKEHCDEIITSRAAPQRNSKSDRQSANYQGLQCASMYLHIATGLIGWTHVYICCAGLNRCSFTTKTSVASVRADSCLWTTCASSRPSPHQRHPWFSDS